MIGTLRQKFLARSPEFVKRAWSRVEASPIGYRLAHGAFWSFAGAVASRVFALVASLLAARLLGKQGFGELGMIQSTIGMFGTLAGFGLGLTATKHVAEFRTANPDRAGRILCMSAMTCWFTGGLAALLLAIAAPWVATHSLAAPQLAGALRVGALYLLLSTVNGGQLGALSGFEAFRRLAGVNLWSGLLSFVCVTVGCWFFAFPGAVWGLVIGQALGCLVTSAVVISEARRFGVPLRLFGWTAELPLLWQFSLPVFLTHLVGQPLEWYALSLLARQPHGYEQTAEFYACLQLRNIPCAVIGIFTAAVLPIYAQAKEDARAQRAVLRLALTITALAALPLLLVMMIAAKPVLFAYGKDFATGVLTLRILLLSLVFVVFVSMARQVLIGDGRAWPTFAIYFAGGIALVGLASFMIPRQMAVGLAWSTLAMDAVRTITCVYCLKGLLFNSKQSTPTAPKNS